MRFLIIQYYNVGSERTNSDIITSKSMRTMKSKLSLAALALAATVAIGMGCAARGRLANGPKLLVIVSSPASPAPFPAPHSTPDSCVVKDPADGVRAIDSLIESADGACDSEDWAAAHHLFLDAVDEIKDLDENGVDGSTIEEYYKEIARRYTDVMPDAYGDSLPDEISLLAFQKQLGESLDSTTISSADSLALQKIINQKKTTYDVPIVWNDRVYKALNFLTRGGKGPLDKWIARSNYFLPTIKKMFVDSGLPVDIAYLPLIESGFNPLAYSRKHAAGMWQFIPSTGKRYGLHKDCWVDERRDFIQSTKAAISYLKKLYDQFNDWHIAIASYNCGENSMCRALGRSATMDYWALSTLPRETKHYVPEFLAALIVAKNPNYLVPAPADIAADTFDLDTVTVDGCLNLYAIADSLKMSYDDLRTMNPHILHWCSHPRNSVTLYLPKGKKEEFLDAYGRSAPDFSVTWYSYRIKQGETLKSIARHFKVSLDAVLTLNDMAPTRRLSVGEDLLIPIPINQSASSAMVIREREQRAAPSYKTVTINGAKVIKYRVRGGDCLWSLARLFRVTPNDLCKWNNIPQAGSIKAGTVLSIYKTPGAFKTVFAPPAAPAASAGPSVSAAPSPSMERSSADSQRPAIAADASAKRIVYYKVRRGDNLWNIAQTFKVPVKELTSINDISMDTTLMPGEVLKVPLSERL